MKIAQTNGRTGVASLRVLGRGEGNRTAADALRRQHVALVRYADPLSWSAAVAVGEALEESEPHDREGNARNDIGILSASAFGPRDTIDHISQSAMEGEVSALRFPAANPGMLAGVSCIVYGLRGPTLNVTLEPRLARFAIETLLQSWLGRGAASEILLLSAPESLSTEYAVRCLRVGRAAPHGDVPGISLTERDWDWWQGDDSVAQELHPRRPQCEVNS